MIDTFIELIPGSGPAYPNIWLFCIENNESVFDEKEMIFIKNWFPFQGVHCPKWWKEQVLSRVCAWINLILLTDPFSVNSVTVLRLWSSPTLTWGFLEFPHMTISTFDLLKFDHFRSAKRGTQVRKRYTDTWKYGQMNYLNLSWKEQIKEATECIQFISISVWKTRLTLTKLWHFKPVQIE